MTEAASGKRRRFALGVSCKTEAVGAEDGIWPRPNAMLTIKTCDVVGRPLPLYVESLGAGPRAGPGAGARGPSAGRPRG